MHKDESLAWADIWKANGTIEKYLTVLHVKMNDACFSYWPLTFPLYAPGNLDITLHLQKVTLYFQDNPPPLLVPDVLM